jgi:protoporphyrinogen oxidase
MLRSPADTLVLGAGMTGLAAGLSSGFPVVEAREGPGGICTSYYIRPGTTEILRQAPADGEAYHFEHGGGHWLFGGDPILVQFLESLVSLKRYARRSGIFFPDNGAYVPYPIQNHLAALDYGIASRALAEILAATGRPCATAEEWYHDRFGKTLCDLFFTPFNELYTAGLWRKVEPQDNYKSPLDRDQVIRGAKGQHESVGYNAEFLYPVEGLDILARRMAGRGEVHYGMEVAAIDPRARTVRFGDGSSVAYRRLISSLPLDRMMEMTGLRVEAPADPHTSVLVLNVGAVKGPKLPQDHWLYVPASRGGFHRVGVYSNVDLSFLPASSRAAGSRTSIYVERAFRGGARPGQKEARAIADGIVRELQDWGFIGEAEAVDPTWIDIAYTWSWPGSKWRAQAIRVLQENGIFQVGRYGRWVFQGITDSLREGLLIGAAFRNGRRNG